VIKNESLKIIYSLDCRLQLICMKLELLVIENLERFGELYLKFVLIVRHILEMNFKGNLHIFLNIVNEIKFCNWNEVVAKYS